MTDQYAALPALSLDEMASDWSSCSAIDPLLLIDGAGLWADWTSDLAAIPIHVESLYGGDLANDVGSDGPFLAQFSSTSSEAWSWCQTVLSSNAGVLLGVRDSQPLLGNGFQGSRRHFRKFNLIKLPDLRPVMFRYYDPRVLLVMRQTMDPDNWRSFAGPFASMVVMTNGSALQLATPG